MESGGEDSPWLVKQKAGHGGMLQTMWFREALAFIGDSLLC